MEQEALPMKLMTTLSISLSLATFALCFAGCGISSLGGSGPDGGGGGGSACATPNPAGCKVTGCPSGKSCVAQGCTSSGCICDAATGDWACDDDCGGGICVQAGPPVPEPPVTDPSALAALANFANCMNKTEFDSLQVDQISQTPLAAIPGVACDLCHSLPNASLNGGRFILDLDGDITFENFKHSPGILKLVTPVMDSTGTFLRLEESLRIIRKGNELNAQGTTQCASEADSVALVQNGGGINVNDPDYCHPNYNVEQALDDKLHIFVSNTIKRAATQICTVDSNPAN
jgi:hypothetical protein